MPSSNTPLPPHPQCTKQQKHNLFRRGCTGLSPLLRALHQRTPSGLLGRDVGVWETRGWENRVGGDGDDADNDADVGSGDRGGDDDDGGAGGDHDEELDTDYIKDKSQRTMIMATVVEVVVVGVGVGLAIG